MFFQLDRPLLTFYEFIKLESVTNEITISLDLAKIAYLCNISIPVSAEFLLFR